MEALFSNVLNLQWQQVVMWGIGALLIYLAIARDMEPTLLLPLEFPHGLHRVRAVDPVRDEADERLVRVRDRPQHRLQTPDGLADVLLLCHHA